MHFHMFLISSSLTLFQSLCHIVSIIFIYSCQGKMNQMPQITQGQWSPKGTCCRKFLTTYRAEACCALKFLGGILLWRQTYICLLQRHPTHPMVRKCHFVATTFDNVDNRKALTNVSKPLQGEWPYWPRKNPQLNLHSMCCLVPSCSKFTS